MRALTRLALAGAILLLLRVGASAETPVERGAYLVKTVGGCGNCHTPRDAAAKPIAGRELAGGFEFDDPGVGHIVGTNITPDPETGIGNWTEAQIITALRDGKRPDGTLIRPPMPIPVYRQLSDGDAAAIAAYLRSLKPVRNKVGEARSRSRCRRATARRSRKSPNQTAPTRSPMAPTSPGRSGIACCVTRRPAAASRSI